MEAVPTRSDIKATIARSLRDVDMDDDVAYFAVIRVLEEKYADRLTELEVLVDEVLREMKVSRNCFYAPV